MDGSNGENQHVDHHLYHVKNYCWYPPLEMYMGTCTDNGRFKAYGYEIRKRDEGENVSFTFEK